MTAETAQTNLEELLGPEPEETVEQVSEQVETPIEEVVAEAPVEQKPDPDEIVRNYKAMAHQERMERKQLQEQMSVMQKRFEQLMAANQQPPAPEPEYDDDPLGATHAKVDKVAKALEDMQRANMGRAQQEQFQGASRARARTSPARWCSNAASARRMRTTCALPVAARLRTRAQFLRGPHEAREIVG